MGKAMNFMQTQHHAPPYGIFIIQEKFQEFLVNKKQLAESPIGILPVILL